MSQKPVSNEEKIKNYQLFQKLDEEVREIKNEMMKNQTSQQKLLTQLNENKMVSQEFKFLKEDSKVYKLVGPILISQDLAESQSIVEKRIKFIEKEL
jgi:prefoldin beta subunit